MSLFPSVFNSSMNTPLTNNIDIKNINGIYVPLKIEDKNNEELSDFNINNFIKINQNNNLGLNDTNNCQLNPPRDLILNDNLSSRFFIGGISAFGLYILYNLLYKK
jgi:hypothetical protein